MKTAVLRLTEKHVTKVVMVVFGEDNMIIQKTLKDLGQRPSLRIQTREFSTYLVANNSGTFTLISAGLGSASVEIVLAELSLHQAAKVVLAGSCGASSHFRLGEPLLLTEAKMVNRGSLEYYLRGKSGLSRPSPLLVRVAKELCLQEARIVSSDAFYGFGCLLDSQGKPVYAGPKLKDSRPPGYVKFKRMYESKKRYLVDMETAFFYGLCATFGLEGVAIKSPSNHIPFHPKRFISQETKAVHSSVAKAIELISLLTR